MLLAVWAIACSSHIAGTTSMAAYTTGYNRMRRCRIIAVRWPSSEHLRQMRLMPLGRVGEAEFAPYHFPTCSFADCLPGKPSTLAAACVWRRAGGLMPDVFKTGLTRAGSWRVSASAPFASVEGRCGGIRNHAVSVCSAARAEARLRRSTTSALPRGRSTPIPKTTRIIRPSCPMSRGSISTPPSRTTLPPARM